jgi:hypothetical protein
VTAATQAGNPHTGCPCLVALRIFDATPGATATSFYMSAVVPNTSIAGWAAYTPIADTWVFPVTAGQHAFTARMARDTGTANIGVEGAVTAIFSPYADIAIHGVEAGGDQP